MENISKISNGVNILTDPEHLKNLMRSLGLKPKDYLGQNFLVSEEVLAEIISIAEINKSDTVLEIGPGLGVLTQHLADKAGKVIAIEKDKNFIQILKNYFKQNKNLEIINEDALRFNFESVAPNYKIVANIPYYLTSHLIQILLSLKNKPSKIVLMIQKEVGERIVAAAGELSLLGISVQIFADAEIAAIVPKENFWPKPKVDSCIVVITPDQKFPQIKDQKLFFRIIKIAFAGKRKQIHNTLANGLNISKEQAFDLLKNSEIEPSKRPQELKLEQWINLYTTISKSRL